MRMKLYEFSESDISAAATAGMQASLQGLVEEKIISQEQATAFRSNHAITVSSKDNWLQGIWSKFIKTDAVGAGTNSDTLMYHCVKILGIGDKNER